MIRPFSKLYIYNRGFTLIELLVVIAIIGVLGSIVFAPFNEARKKGRDGKRVAELKSLQSELILFADDHDGCFPNSAQTMAPFNNNSIQTANNKYVSATFAIKIKSLNAAPILSDPLNAWTATSPYGFRSVGDPASCSMSGGLPSNNLYPYYQLMVELETKEVALIGDLDANYSTPAYGGTSPYNGLDITTHTREQDCPAGGVSGFDCPIDYEPFSPELCIDSTVGTWDCVYDIGG